MAGTRVTTYIHDHGGEPYQCRRSKDGAHVIDFGPDAMVFIHDPARLVALYESIGRQVALLHQGGAHDGSGAVHMPGEIHHDPRGEQA